MRYDDIVRLTPQPHYKCDLNLDGIETALEHYEKTYGLELEPDFQRAHVWTRAKRIAYVEHLLRGGRGSHELKFNCYNWRHHREQGPMTLVDGLQRLTALRLFLGNKLPAFGHLFSEIEGHVPNDVLITFFVNDLPDRAAVLRWYLELNSGGVVHKPKELARVRELLEKEEGRA